MAFGQKPPYKDLTDPENEKVLGTLTGKAWGKLTALSARAKFYALTETEGELNPMDFLIHEARQSSGSIGGEHRKDLVEALKGPQGQKVGVGLGADEEPALEGL